MAEKKILSTDEENKFYSALYEAHNTIKNEINPEIKQLLNQFYQELRMRAINEQTGQDYIYLKNTPSDKYNHKRINSPADLGIDITQTYLDFSMLGGYVHEYDYALMKSLYYTLKVADQRVAEHKVDNETGEISTLAEKFISCWKAKDNKVEQKSLDEEFIQKKIALDEAQKKKAASSQSLKTKLVNGVAYCANLAYTFFSRHEGQQKQPSQQNHISPQNK